MLMVRRQAALRVVARSTEVPVGASSGATFTAPTAVPRTSGLAAAESGIVHGCRLPPNIKIQKTGAKEVGNAQVRSPASDLER